MTWRPLVTWHQEGSHEIVALLFSKPFTDPGSILKDVRFLNEGTGSSPVPDPLEFEWRIGSLVVAVFRVVKVADGLQVQWREECP